MPRLHRSVALLTLVAVSPFSPQSTASSVAEKFRIHNVAALIPPASMPTEVQLEMLKQCRSTIVDPANLLQISSSDKELLQGRDSRRFFANGAPQVAMAWYPAALLDPTGRHAEPGVTASIADTFAICFLKKGYRYGTYRQKIAFP